MSCFRVDLKDCAFPPFWECVLVLLHGKLGKGGRKRRKYRGLVRLRNRLQRDRAGLGKIVQRNRWFSHAEPQGCGTEFTVLTSNYNAILLLGVFQTYSYCIAISTANKLDPNRG
jgi:hypothetical protein